MLPPSLYCVNFSLEKNNEGKKAVFLYYTFLCLNPKPAPKLRKGKTQLLQIYYCRHLYLITSMDKTL